jgi:hypothetical protein
MRKIIHSKTLVFFIVTQLLLISSGLSQEQIVPPCARARYDAEHENIRSYSMLKLIFSTEHEIDLYAQCYFNATGVDLGVEKDRQKEKVRDDRAELILLTIVLVVGYYGYTHFKIGGPSLGDINPA